MDHLDCNISTYSYSARHCQKHQKQKRYPIARAKNAKKGYCQRELSPTWAEELLVHVYVCDRGEYLTVEPTALRLLSLV